MMTKSQEEKEKIIDSIFNSERYANGILPPNVISYLIFNKYYLKRRLKLEKNDAAELENKNFLKRHHSDMSLFIEEYLKKINKERRKQFFCLADDELYNLRKKEEFVATDLKLSQAEIDWEQTLLKEMDDYFDELKSKYCA
ncbi:MAG: hypothetical protein HRT87_07420 [Legionellales bacterium]|nr:hypothetical protein [Legionellales bacterium]